MVLLNESIPLASLSPFTDAAYCSLSLSLCDVAMLSVGKGGGPASRSNDADCISAPPTKIIKHRLIKLNFKRPDLGSFIDMSNLQIKINLQRHLCTDFEEMNRIVFPLFL